MSAVNNLLDKYKKACSIASDNGCAESLGLHRASISEWRRGKSWPSEDHIVKLAKAAGEDAGIWLLSVHAERTAPGAVQKEWQRLTQRLATAGIILLATGLFQAHAETVTSTQTAQHVYIMRNSMFRCILHRAAHATATTGAPDAPLPLTRINGCCRHR